MRQPLYLRLRPFLRRELKTKLVSAVVTVLVLTGLSWLGISALTQIDSREAHALRVSSGIESAWAVCGAPGGPACSYEDREQARVDAKFAQERRLRLAILAELDRRVEHGLAQLDQATELVGAAKLNPRNGALQGDTVALRMALSSAAVDLRPAPITSVEGRRDRLIWPLEVSMPDIPGDCRAIDFDGIGWVGGCDLTRDGVPAQRVDQRRMVLEGIGVERATLRELDARIDRIRSREVDGELSDAVASRIELVGELLPSPQVTSDYAERMAVAGWLAVQTGDDDPSDDGTTSLVGAARKAGMPDVGTELAALARGDVAELARAVQDSGASVWYGAWLLDGADRIAITKPSVRYRSPVATQTRLQLLGSLMLLLGGILLVVVGPTVTATTTAREREAGTLPVLRMTGLSAGDLAMAMTIGPNVFALVAGLALVAVSGLLLAGTAGFVATATVLVVLLALSAATHLTAIGLGDALGQRVNAMVVGGLLGLGVLLPGAIGAVMVVGDMASTGLLLGPLPAVLSSTVALSGLPYAQLLGQLEVSGPAASEMSQAMLVYAIATQMMLGVLCLLSWRRRVEQPWAPLFRPLEGAILGLASVGCSALAVLDLSEQINVQTYDQVNLITFVATGFLMPVLGWLLVSSLVRPARAAAVTSGAEVRRAFGRFQVFVVLTAVALAGAYTLVLERSGLGSEKSEIMWATIAQGLLVAETAVAALLLASRKREGRHRVLMIGAALVLLQLAFTAGVYNLEVEHVAITQSSGSPLLLGMDASPYWIAFLVVLWAAGLGMVLAALLRERDRGKAEAAASGEPEGEDAEGEEPQRWLH